MTKILDSITALIVTVIGMLVVTVGWICGMQVVVRKHNRVIGYVRWFRYTKRIQ